MEKTLTIRLSRAQDEALTRQARIMRKTRSEVVRELIDRGLERPLGERIGHLRGRLVVPAPSSGWSRRIKDRNWR